VPTIGAQFNALAEQAVREKRTHLGYLEALLSAESEERERNTIGRRIKEAHLPRVKTLEEFDYSLTPMISAAQLQDLASGGYIERAEPVLLIGDCGTGKTHGITISMSRKANPWDKAYASHCTSVAPCARS
jgi:DNA replication protein DnaC